MSQSKYDPMPYNTATMEVSEEIAQAEISRAVNLFKQGKYDLCLKIYHTLVSTLSSLPERYSLKLRRFYELPQKPLAGRVCHPKMPTVLEQRSATYQKIGDYKSALQDAEKVLYLNPLECRGYLRRGKLLQVLGERVRAYKCYQQGKFVLEKAQKDLDFSVNPKLWKQLNAAYADLNRALKEERREGKSEAPAAPVKKSSRSVQRRIDEIVPAKRKLQHQPPVKKAKNTLDFFEKLPVDLVGEVYSHLNIEQVIKSHLVCKLWYHTLLRMPHLYSGTIRLRPKVLYPEYQHCMILLKKVLRTKSTHLVIPTTCYENHLQRILLDLLQNSISFKTLGITSVHFSQEVLLQLLVELKWAGFEKLRNLDRFIMTTSSPYVFEESFIQIFPNLTSLEILTVIDVHNTPSRRMRVLTELLDNVAKGLADVEKRSVSEKRFNTNMESNAERGSTGAVESLNVQALPEGDSSENRDQGSLKFLKLLVLVNKRVHCQSRSTDSENIFRVRPTLLKVSMPNLTNLTVACFDFGGLSDTFRHFLAQAPNLKRIDLESNSQLSFEKFLRSLGECSFSLDTLRFREISQSGPTDLDEINLHNVQCLKSVQELDLYGSSLSNRGLLRILQVSPKIQTLNIGNSKYLCFRNTHFVRHSLMCWKEMLAHLPMLKSLYVPEMAFDHVTMTQMNKAIVEVYGPETEFKTLDLSLCPLIDGISLLCLFEASKNENAFPHAQSLILNGLIIAKETFQMLERKKYVQRIESDPFKIGWRTWGVNSHYIP